MLLKAMLWFTVMPDFYSVDNKCLKQLVAHPSTVKVGNNDAK